MRAVLFKSAIEQIRVKVIALVYLEYKQISSSKSNQGNTLFIIRTDSHEIIYTV